MTLQNTCLSPACESDGFYRACTPSIIHHTATSKLMMTIYTQNTQKRTQIIRTNKSTQPFMSDQCRASHSSLSIEIYLKTKIELRGRLVGGQMEAEIDPCINVVIYFLITQRFRFCVSSHAVNVNCLLECPMI